MGVVGFVRGRKVYLGAPWGTSALFGDAGFFEMRPWCRRVLSGSLGSLGYALGVVGFVRGRWVHLGGHGGSSGPVGVAWYIGMRPGGRWDRLGSLGSLGCAMGVVGYVGCHLGCAQGDVGFVQGRWGASMGSSVSFRVTGFIGLRPSCLRVRSGSLGSFDWTQRAVGFGLCRWLHWDTPWGSSGWLWVAGVRPGGHLIHTGPPSSLGWGRQVVGVIGVRPAGRRVHSGSLGSLGFALRVVVFIRVRWVHS